MPLAAWPIMATAAQIHHRLGREVEAQRFWVKSAAGVRHIAIGLARHPDLEAKKILTHPEVQAVLDRALAAWKRAERRRA